MSPPPSDAPSPWHLEQYVITKAKPRRARSESSPSAALSEAGAAVTKDNSANANRKMRLMESRYDLKAKSGRAISLPLKKSGVNQRGGGPIHSLAIFDVTLIKTPKKSASASSPLAGECLRLA